ncbi:uncharacterized protein DEA37_0005400 [Paragonimus westermani]|uniref:DBF4-type domain-containing protein n=1 Tax=Paragonimus westermani TaxID=34504 RepID=A0A5J4NF11_9TREM|nr:uncharacterized protein DEA37_0005400 [Paragonimus westermani]
MVENVDPGLMYSCSNHSADLLPVIPSISSQTDLIGTSRARSRLTSPAVVNRMAPLSGKKIFMHYDPGTLPDEHLENALRKLKADLVDFFSRDIHYIITNRASNRLPQDSPQPTTTHTQPIEAISANSTAVKPGLDGVLASTSFQTPIGLKTPLMSSGKPANPTVTRGRAMLLAARKATLIETLKRPTSVESRPSMVLHQLQPTNTSDALTRPNPDAPQSTKHGSSPSPTNGVNTPNDLLTRARRLGIRILTVDSVVKWIRNLPSDVQLYIQTAEHADSEELQAELSADPERDRIGQVRLLITPCIKIIDLSYQSRPLYMDRTDYLPGLWNLLNRQTSKLKDTGVTDTSSPQTTAGGSGSVPAASLGWLTPQVPATGTTAAHSILSRQSGRHKRKDRIAAGKLRAQPKDSQPLQRSASVPMKINDPTDRLKATGEEEPSGYCECCSIAFPNLLEHLHCADHQQFANNSENYRLLDDVLCRLPSLQDFLTSESTRRRPAQTGRHTSTAHKKRNPSGSKTGRIGTLKSPVISVSHTCSGRESNEVIDDRAASVGDPPPLLEIVPSTLNTDQFNPVTSVPAVSLPCPPCLKSLGRSLTCSPSNHVERVLLFSDDEDVDGDVGEEFEQIKQDVLVKQSCSITVSSGYEVQQYPAETQFSLIEPVPIVASLHENVQLKLDAAPQTGDECICASTLQQCVDAWQSVCSQIYVNDHFKRGTQVSSTEWVTSESPVLERFHVRCNVCSRVHIPTSLSPELGLRVHSLLGCGHRLDGVGCRGFPQSLLSSNRSASDTISSLTDSNSKPSSDHPVVALPPVHTLNSPHGYAEYVVSNSPVFGSKAAVALRCRSPDQSLPTSPMREQSCEKEHSPVYVATPEVIISTPRIPLESVGFDTLDIEDMNDSVSRSPSMHSDTTRDRKSLSWLLNSASFEAKFPIEDRCNENLPSHDELFKTNKSTKTRSIKQSNNCSPRRRSSTEGLSLCDLPVLKRAKLNANKQPPTKKIGHSPKHKRTKKCISKKKSQNLVCVTPHRTPRLAAQVARESISLSVRALFSPSSMDRYAARAPEWLFSPRLSPLKRCAVNSSRLMPTASKLTFSPNFAKQRRRRQLCELSRRPVLFPDSPTSSSDTFDGYTAGCDGSFPMVRKRTFSVHKMPSPFIDPPICTSDG